jgi:hypothetical protein
MAPPGIVAADVVVAAAADAVAAAGFVQVKVVVVVMVVERRRCAVGRAWQRVHRPAGRAGCRPVRYSNRALLRRILGLGSGQSRSNGPVRTCHSSLSCSGRSVNQSFVQQNLGSLVKSEHGPPWTKKWSMGGGGWRCCSPIRCGVHGIFGARQNFQEFGVPNLKGGRGGRFPRRKLPLRARVAERNVRNRPLRTHAQAKHGSFVGFT